MDVFDWAFEHNNYLTPPEEPEMEDQEEITDDNEEYYDCEDGE